MPLRRRLGYAFAMNGNEGSMTLELDAATLQEVEHLAQAWCVSKQEAVHRAVEQAGAAAVNLPRKPDRLAAFKTLQRRLQLTPATAAEWQTSVRDARR